jgi:hypothetical protein
MKTIAITKTLNTTASRVWKSLPRREASSGGSR